MFPEFKNLSLPAMEKEVAAYWASADVFKKSVEQRPESNSFVFYEGPPSANGMPGIHHVMGRTVKDLFCRYRAMKGFRVERKAGWDTHGLPIELSVEKELGITKEDIGKSISVDEYNQKCKETVMRYKHVWDRLTNDMGYWVDLDDPYVTYENDYIESVWNVLKRLYDKGLMYKGYTIQPFSPAAGTGLSSHELNQPGCYRDITDTSAVAQFRVKGEEALYLLAWTTTPWTLPSNTALAVGANVTYVKVRSFNRYTGQPAVFILAKERLNAYFSEQNPELKAEDLKAGNKPIPYLEIVEELPGSALENLEYEQLMPYVQPDKPAFRVLLGDFVTTEDGTGLVHIAPTFGADDFRVANQYGIPPLMVKDADGNPMPLVDRQGRFVDEVTDFAKRYVKDFGQEEERPVDVDIVIKLKGENKLFVSEKYVHSYPHCWRTDKPVLYYPLDSWFVKASSMRERMLELNQTINWKPASTGEGRFGKWLENLQDWNLSRSRYWGIPLPIWRSADGRTERCIGSAEELQQAVLEANQKLGLNQQVPADFHRPYIDEVVLVGSNGERLERELDLIDVWFDSGSMPYAQWHYPFENQDKFKSNFPADFIAEGVDQTRGWFYTLHAIAVMAFDSVAYKTVVSNGLVLDKTGAKMSKRLGNAVDPFQTIEQYGADSTRWYMISNAPPWDNLKFDPEGLEDVSRRFFKKLTDVYSFFSLYANIDRYNGQETGIPVEERPEIDRWIISVLHTLIREVDADFNDYDPTPATRKIMHFVDEHLSNWYVRLNRRRFWKGELTDDKIAAYQTLQECLLTVSQLMAPVAPFYADWLYRNMQGEAAQSVHLCDYPESNSSWINPGLEERMDYAQRIASLVLSLRKKERIRVRQPLQKVLLPILDDSFRAQVEAVEELILAEVNVKELEYVSDTDGMFKKRAKANFKTLGRRLGKQMKAAADAIAELNSDAIARFQRDGRLELNLSGETVEIGPDDLEISTDDIPGWQVASDQSITVALDLTLTDELVAEGLARDLINRIQNIRKSQDFNVVDRINIRLQMHPALQGVLNSFGEYIRSETLADNIELVPGLQTGEQLELTEMEPLWAEVEKS